MIIQRTGTATILIETPAKLNLFLEVLRRRPDGFHDLETVMHSVDLYDTVRIERTDRGPGVVDFASTGIPAGDSERNLARRAGQLFFGALGGSGGALIHLAKAIPVGAGLGGGSSDAAAVLVGLNELFERPFSRVELAGLGGSLGSDVPFFLHCGTAICRGRGEIVEPVDGIGPLAFALVYPGFPVLTRDVYQNLNLALTEGKRDINISLDILKHGASYGSNESFFNRLQGAALRTSSPLREVWEKLEFRDSGAFTLSGSGSCFFKCTGEPGREMTTGRLRGAGPWQVFLVRSSPRNPAFFRQGGTPRWRSPKSASS